MQNKIELKGLTAIISANLEHITHDFGILPALLFLQKVATLGHVYREYTNTIPVRFKTNSVIANIGADSLVSKHEEHQKRCSCVTKRDRHPRCRTRDMRICLYEDIYIYMCVCVCVCV